MKHSILTRYRLLPYIYTSFYLSNNKSHPIIQPLWYQFNNDENTFNKEDSFMFGYAFYIKPIVEPNINEIDVYLPQNNNKNAIFYEISELNTINIYNGGNKYHLIGYGSRIPVLRYGGTIIIERHRIRRSSLTMKYDPVTIIIALDNNYNAYGYNYIDDEFIFQKLQYISNENKLINIIIDKPNNDVIFNNIQQIEVERIVIMGKDIQNKKFTQIQIKQLTNSRKTKQFGVAQNTLAIRKPQILLNFPFEITLQ